MKPARPIPEIVVVADQPPPPKVSGKRCPSPATAAVIGKASELPPGGWFVWPDPPTSWRTVSRKHLAPVSAEAYLAYGGRVIVRTTREGQAKLSQPGPAKASPVAAPANPPGSSVGSTGAAGGSGGNVWPQAVPPPSDRHQRLILKAMSRLGVAVTKSNLASAMGLQACPADAMDALVKSGLVQSRENKSGRLEFFLTEGGVSAAFEILRQERT